LNRLFTSIFCFLFSLYAFAGGVTGTVKNNKGERMPFTSILVKGTNTGTMSNDQGQFQLRLEPGSYEVIFQFLGYKTLILSAEVGTDFTELFPVMEEQGLQMSEVVVSRTKEDPAYSIMRKAISKSVIHQMQVKSYKAKVYVKGSGKLTSIPWLVRGKLKEEGIQENTTMFTESVTELQYTYPAKYVSRVLSVRSNMDKYPSPNQYIYASFYKPKIGEGISPLNPKAFSFYKFQYEGSFNDRGFEVHKIKVIPRSKADDLFSGTLNIIEDLWCIHSLSLNTEHDGTRIHAEQIFAPFESVWMPVNHQYTLKGKVLGFGFDFRYAASIKDYEVVVNPALVKPIEVVDAKQEPEKAKEAKKALSGKSNEEKNLEKLVNSNEKLTLKNMRQLAKAYRKSQRQERVQKEPEKARIIREDSVVIDSIAYKRDSTFWELERGVPLTLDEVASTTKLDSIRLKKEEKSKKDTGKIIKSGDGFDTMPILLGYSWSFGAKDEKGAKRYRLRYKGLGDSHFNTVEGYTISSGLSLRRFLSRYYNFEGNENRSWIEVGGTGRYAFARNKWLGFGQIKTEMQHFSAGIEGGSYVSQWNEHQPPISPIVNSFATLFWELNYMRLMEKDYLKAWYSTQIGQQIKIKITGEWAERRYLNNSVRRSVINWTYRDYMPNEDFNLYQGTSLFNRHRVAILQADFAADLFSGYGIRNGKKYKIGSSMPIFLLNIRQGLSGIAGSESNFTLLQGGIEQNTAFIYNSQLIYYLGGGFFADRSKVFFPDFFHFQGNRFFLITQDPLKSFRGLDYYLYSRPQAYAEQHVNFTPNRLLLTRIRFIKSLGWRETISYHGLTQQHVPQYSEAVYGIDGIFRFLRFETVASYSGSRYSGLFFRLGVTIKVRANSYDKDRGREDDETSISISF
jgi:hypothetical protein